MEEDEYSEDGAKTVQDFPPKRIRSSVRRRILDRLSEGRATVSEISRATSMRLPHTSAELKRMRREDLVYSDDITGSRGASIALTVKGWNIMRSDEIARLQSLPTTQPPDSALGRLVSVNDGNLLVAFIRRPEEGPLALPDLPLGTSYSDSQVAWTWAEPCERKPRWISAENFQSVPPPLAGNDSSSLASWGASTQVWGLQKFKFIDSDNRSQLATGSWFGGYSKSEDLVSSIRFPEEGKWRLGSLVIGGPSIRLDQPLLALDMDRISRETLLDSATHGAVTLAPLRKPKVSARKIPLDVLSYWVETAHPRLGTSERSVRLRSLQDSLSSPESMRLRRKIDDATWRRFTEHWGGAEWSEEPINSGDWIDTRNISEKAEAVLIRWFLDNCDAELVIESRKHSHSLFTKSSRLQEKIRLLISSKWKNPPISNLLHPHRILPSLWVVLDLHQGLRFPVNISPKVSTNMPLENVIWTPPTNASELILSHGKIVDDESFVVNLHSLPDLDEGQIIRAAVRSYPIGDADWANRVEIANPLASWIASPPSERWSRWERLGEQLGNDWIQLMRPEHIPRTAFAIAASNAPSEWCENLVSSIRSRLRYEPDLPNDLRKHAEISSAKDASWLAHILLSEIPWYSEELQRDLATWGLDRFLEHPPPRCSESIHGLHWLSDRFPIPLQAESEDWRNISISIGYSMPQDHDLHLWAVLRQWYEEGHRPHHSLMNLIIKRLPEEWWAPVAETVLTVLSDESESILLLSQMDIAWPALIIRPAGEMHHMPGGISTTHKGVRRTLLTRLERMFENPEWVEGLPGSIMLRDLAETLRSARTLSAPARGLSHPMVGWLAFPEHLWPSIESIQAESGDTRISSRLMQRLSGWHPELSRNTMSI